ncbi:uncharacterized protein ARMOST_02734 [Armillaria ostoyae]|uniref:Uncharacterized protein n=1 Tax=Armillaria ostoyae TaxID=47428 RepID=A0A284QSQ3_ARMOS|nr:uncharacterized protein ARMOST_02734 [Armillaria ostoyae]
MNRTADPQTAYSSHRFPTRRAWNSDDDDTMSFLVMDDDSNIHKYWKRRIRGGRNLSSVSLSHPRPTTNLSFEANAESHTRGWATRLFRRVFSRKGDSACHCHDPTDICVRALVHCTVQWTSWLSHFLCVAM